MQPRSDPENDWRLSFCWKVYGYEVFSRSGLDGKCRWFRKHGNICSFIGRLENESGVNCESSFSELRSSSEASCECFSLNVTPRSSALTDRLFAF